MKTPFFGIALFFCLTQMSYSQEDGLVSLALPVRNSLTFNRYVINPTFSFVREQHKYISIYNKREWVQFDDAPQTYLASYNGRFGENIGAGVGLFQQNYGVYTTFGGILNFAYNVRLDRDSNLTFGINMGAYSSGINTGNVVTNFQDPSLDNIPSSTSVLVNPGINYGTTFLDFGISANNLVVYNLESSELISDNPEQNIQAHLMYTGYMSSGGFFDESKFSGLVRSEFGKEITTISGIAMLTVPKGIWMQLGYNTQFGASGGLGLNITPEISMEYSYEKTFGALSDFGTSHEITLAYRFKNEDNYNYSGDDEVTGLFSDGKKRRRVSKKPKSNTVVSKPKDKALEKAEKLAAQAKAQETRKAKTEAAQARLAEQAKVREEAQAAAQATQAAIEAEAKVLAEREAQVLADAQAKQEAEATAQAAIEAEAKVLAEREAQAIADAQAKQEAEARAQAAIEAEAKLAAEREAQAIADAQAKQEAEATAQAAIEAEAKLAAEREAQAIADAQAKQEAEARAQAALEAEAKLAAEREAQALVDAQAKQEAEARAQAALEAEAKLLAEREAQALAEAQAKEEAETKLAAEREAQALADAQAKEEAEAKAKADEEAQLIANPKDAIGKSMKLLAKSTEAFKSVQSDLLKQLNEAVEIKNKDLKDLKEENDLSEQGIFKAPQPFKSITAENAALEAIKIDLEKIINARNAKINELESLYDEKYQAGTITNDVVMLYYKKEIEQLKSEQATALRTKSNLESQLETINVGLDYERKRRIKRASFNNEEDRYKQDRAALTRIRRTTRNSQEPLKVEDFDFGEAASSGIQILKNVKNVESGFYLIVAVHTNKAKRDEFLTKAVASGRKDIDFFFDVNTSRYYIYYKKSDSIERANESIKSKEDKPYNNNMSIVKIEK